MDNMHPRAAIQAADAAGPALRDSLPTQQVAEGAKAGGAVSPTRRTGVLWGVLAVITCPCHLPVLAVVLSGTALGALLEEHFTVALVLFSLLFLLSLRAVTRALSRTSSSRD